MRENLISIEIHGIGEEIVLGNIEENHIEALKSSIQDNVCLEDIEKIVGSPWDEIDSIWHHYGPDGEEIRYINSETRKEMDTLNLEFIDFHDISKITGKKFENSGGAFPKCGPVYDHWVFGNDAIGTHIGRYILIVKSVEKGFWGEVEYPADLVEKESSADAWHSLCEVGVSFCFETPQGDIDVGGIMAYVLDRERWHWGRHCSHVEKKCGYCRKKCFFLDHGFGRR